MSPGQWTKQVSAAHRGWWVKRRKAGVTCWFRQEQQGCHSRKEKRMPVSGQHLPKLIQEGGQGCWSLLRKRFCSGTDSVGLGKKTMQGSRRGAGSFWFGSPLLALALSVSPHFFESSEPQVQILRTPVTQEGPELWGKRGHSQSPWLLHSEAWQFINSCFLVNEKSEYGSYGQEETRNHMDKTQGAFKQC